MSQIIEMPDNLGQGDQFKDRTAELMNELEAGNVLHCPNWRFSLSPTETRLLNPRIADPARKNISVEADGKTLRGVVAEASLLEDVRAMIARFQRDARELIDAVCAPYGKHLRPAPASLRLHRVETRQASWRKDDSRLHVDAFPSRPLAGTRILRVFVNIHPGGEPRVWRVGEPFERVAEQFLPRLRAPFPGLAPILKALKITKGLRTPYDHYMLGLHDAMKADLTYQQRCAQKTMPFSPGSAWICYSDQTSHAVMSGQFMMEQTYFLAKEAMMFPKKSPQSILERHLGTSLT